MVSRPTRSDSSRRLLDIVESAWHINMETSEIIGKIQKALKAGANPNAKYTDGKTCLHLVAKNNIKGSTEIVDLLLSRGALPEIADQYGNTPLLYANFAENENFELIKKLIEFGAYVDRSNIYGRTSLHNAACQGRTEIVRLLLSSGAYPDPIDSNTYTPLMLAVAVKSITHEQRFDISQQLIQAGAYVNRVKRYDNMSILHYACLHGNVKTVDLIISSGASFSTDLYGKGLNSLFYATISGNKDVARRLIDAGLNVNHVNKTDVYRGLTKPLTVLHVAIEKNDVDMVKFLLEQKANPNLMNDKVEDSTLALAAVMDHQNIQPITRLLLSYGANMYAIGTGWYESLLDFLRDYR
ncbi:hypothetical protein QAD02_023911 [Eretmocerus hayati]|uniref:Uncharacterized protein n=1 Tax=Eretmocerus hayati TaxID=131215 RepID=A0ACC2PX61_9HYME|nr:hypothetical protein QAD02_023911 [Eretmocerus hayati]